MLCEIGIELGILVHDAKQMLKCPIDGSKELKLSQMANGISADSAMRCPRRRKLRQRRVNWTKQNFIEKTASEKESLTPSRRTNDQEPRCVMGDSISEVENSVNDETTLFEENKMVSNKTIRGTTEQQLARRSLKESDWFL